MIQIYATIKSIDLIGWRELNDNARYFLQNDNFLSMAINSIFKKTNHY
jgi:hypothetical protein